VVPARVAAVIIVTAMAGTVVIVAAATARIVVIVVPRAVVIVIEMAHAIVPDLSPTVVDRAGADAFARRAVLDLDLDVDPGGAGREDHFDLAATRLLDL
jgi:hypothetical protein